MQYVFSLHEQTILDRPHLCPYLLIHPCTHVRVCTHTPTHMCTPPPPNNAQGREVLSHFHAGADVTMLLAIGGTDVAQDVKAFRAEGGMLWRHCFFVRSRR